MRCKVEIYPFGWETHLFADRFDDEASGREVRMHGCKTIYCFKKDIIPGFSGDGLSVDGFAEGGSSFSPF